MKKLIFVLLVIIALVYLGVLNFNSEKVNTGIKKGVSKILEYTKKGAVKATEELKKANAQ